jgi:transcriptional regulator
MSGKPKEPLTTEQKAQVATLSAAGWSQNKIAKQVGRSRTAVKNALAEPEIQRAVIDEKAELAELYRSKARAVVTSISDADIAKSSLQQKAISSGILLDKSLLLTGEAPPVANIHVLLEVCELIRERRDRRALPSTVEAAIPPPTEP